MRKWLIALLGCVVLVVFAAIIVLRLPAGYLLAQVFPAGGRVGWEAPQGVISSGTTRLYVDSYDLGTLSWETVGVGIVPPQWEGQVTVGGAEVRGDGTLTAGLTSRDLAASSVSLAAPANWIQHVLAAPFLLLDGELDAQFSEAEIVAGKLTTLTGTIVWRNARVEGRINADIGGVRVDFTTEDGLITGRVRDTGGDLKVEGTVTMDDAQYVVDLTLSTAPTNIPLRQALEVLGRPDARGRLPLRITGPMIALW